MASKLAALFALLPMAAMAQVPQPGQDMAQIVVQNSRALFRILPEGNGAAIREYFADTLRQATTDEAIAFANEKISERANGILGYSMHGLTFFPRDDQLLAGVEFSATGVNGSLICGFLMWSMPTPDEIGLIRIDQSLAERADFVKLDYPVAVEALSKFNCPEDAAKEFLASLPSAP